MATSQLSETVVVERSRHRFTVSDYHHMGEKGILTPDDRVELIGGEVVQKPVMYPPHAAAVTQLTKRLLRRLGDDPSVRVQLPLTIPQYDEPEPDVVVCRPREDEYATAHPQPPDVLIAIEVSDSTLAFDQRVKVPIYARAGIPESWIVDLTRRGDAIRRYSDPDRETGEYRTVVSFGRGQEIVSLAIPELSLPVDAVLGQRPAETTPQAE